MTEEKGVSVKEITLDVAEKMIEAARSWATGKGNPCFVITDKAGAIIAAERMDGCPFGALATYAAIGKAYTAAYTEVSTGLLANMLDPTQIGKPDAKFYPSVLTQIRCKVNMIPGGEPIRDEEMNVIGAMGCGGFPDAADDTQACRVGISVLYA